MYRAFGLTISSEVALLELPEANADGCPDLSILMRSTGRRLPTAKEGVTFDYLDPDGVFMAWPGVAAVRIVDPANVIVEAYEGVPQSYLAFPLLGPVMAWVLQKRGLQVFHASAVEVNGACFAFMGDKLAGKSTTAAAFVRAGHRLITDDLLAVDMSDPKRPIVLPAFPQIKLGEDSARSVKIDGATALPLVYEGFSKRQHKLPDMHYSTIPASHFLVLKRQGAQPSIEELGAGDDLRALMRFGYASRFGSAPYSDLERATDFRNCAGITKACSVATVHVPPDLDRLDELVSMMVELVAAENLARETNV